MTYATQGQLEERYGRQTLIDLTDRAVPASGEIDLDVVNRALTDTDALIDGYLAGRYALPLAETPALMTDLALQIAIYKMHAHAAEEKIEQDYQGALRMLREISMGTIRLSVEGVEPDVSGSGQVLITECDRELTSDTMKGFI